MRLGIGTRVRLRPNSGWGPQSTYMGKEYEGTIIAIRPMFSLPYRVEWDFSKLLHESDITLALAMNSYGDEDLMFAAPPTNNKNALHLLKGVL